LDRAGSPGWANLSADLTDYAGAEVELVAEVAVTPPDAVTEVWWSPLRIAAASGERRRPNILFVLVDTLRADHLGAYGYERPTSPEIDALLAEPGVVFERAYAQAPWTLPSVASFLTGQRPGDFWRGGPVTYRIPPSVATLAERLSSVGYETAGFVANFSLHADGGFDRGFSTYYVPPPSLEAMRAHADDVGSRAIAWLREQTDRPFFGYLHFIDPHDPYENPETVAGVSPFLPDYRGPVDGGWIHGLYTGQLTLPDAAADLEQVKALYDSEIHYVDRWIGRVLRSLPPERLRDTLIVFTADHGEELFDHGGWKHGHGLYEEQIRVPLILRWDGEFAAPRRIATPVPLLDLVPTLLAVAGADGGRDAFPGIDLLPTLRLGNEPPRRILGARHLSSGPQRAVAVLDGRRYLLFDRATPFAPSDAMVEHLWRLDLRRLRREELYDLARDPEQRNPATDATDAAEVSLARRDLAPWLHRELDRDGDGLRVVASGLAVGATLDATIETKSSRPLWSSYFLADRDSVRVRGSKVLMHLEGDGTLKGIRLQMPDAQDLQAVDAGSLSVAVGPGRRYAGGPLPAASLAAAGWPVDPSVAGLWLWRPKARGEKPAAAADPETLERLRALGYIQ
jgi:arylsulfatase A-like enzyme